MRIIHEMKRAKKKIFGFVLYKHKSYLEIAIRNSERKKNPPPESEEITDYQEYSLIHKLHNGMKIEVKRTLLREELK